MLTTHRVTGDAAASWLLCLMLLVNQYLLLAASPGASPASAATMLNSPAAPVVTLTTLPLKLGSPPAPTLQMTSGDKVMTTK